VTAKQAIEFVRRHGVVLESARGPVPNLAEKIAGEPIQGSWWGHPTGKKIFAVTRAIRATPQILTCRLVSGKITYVHGRLWPALIRLADEFPGDHLAAVREAHTSGGRHMLHVVAFPDWVPAIARTQARRLTVAQARRALGPGLIPAG
jgi:hypothetical protein